MSIYDHFSNIYHSRPNDPGYYVEDDLDAAEAREAARDALIEREIDERLMQQSFSEDDDSSSQTF